MEGGMGKRESEKKGNQPAKRSFVGRHVETKSSRAHSLTRVLTKLITLAESLSQRKAFPAVSRLKGLRNRDC